MLKFFRKYNKVILVVGGSLLMVIFLLPAGLTQFAGSGSLAPTMAKMGDRSLTTRDRQQAGAELNAVAMTVGPAMLSAFNLDQDAPAEHWLLLSETAERAGLVGGVRDGQSFISEAARISYRQGLVDQARFLGETWLQQQLFREDEEVALLIARIEENRREAQQSLGLTTEEFDIALSKARGVWRMLNAADTTSIFSRPEAVQLAKEIRDTATVSGALLPATQIADSLEDPPIERQEAHFEEYRDVDASEDPMGIGYRQPDAVQFEALRIDHLALASRIPLDPVEMRKYFIRNQDQFPADTTFEDNETSVRERYRVEETNRVKDRLNQLIQNEVARWRRQLEGTSRKKVVPADWELRAPRFGDLVTMILRELTDQFGVTDPVAVTGLETAGGFWDFEGLTQLPIGSSRLPVPGGMTLPFPQIAMEVQELGGDERLGIQTGLIYGPMRDANGSFYYFRIVDTRPAARAQNLESVSSQVVRDLKLLDALDLLEEQADSYRQQIVDGGLSSVAESLGLEVVSPMTVTEVDVRTSPVGPPVPEFNDEAFRTAVIENARLTDPTSILEQTPSMDRTAAAVIREQRGLALAELISWRPLTIEQFRTSLPAISAAARRSKGVDLSRTYSFESLTERLDFRWMPGFGPEAEEGEESAGDLEGDAVSEATGEAEG